MSLGDYAIFIGVVFAVNLMPAFGPPTWLVIVFFKVGYELDLVPLVLFGATAAAGGRYLLATGARALRDRMSPERIADLDALRDDLESRPGSTFGGLTLFLLSPLPSAQMFEAAGVTGVPLRPLTLAFWCGRLITYTIYATAASFAVSSFDDVIEDGIRSPWVIALNVVMLALVVVIARLPWRRIIAKRVRVEHRTN